MPQTKEELEALLREVNKAIVSAEDCVNELKEMRAGIKKSLLDSQQEPLFQEQVATL